MTLTPQQEYQCSFCTRNRYNGGASCPLPVGDLANPDIREGMNRFIKNCGCGSFHDTRSQPAPSKQEIRENVLEEVRTACIKDESVGFTIFRILQELRRQ
jgi:hypothetical protein